MSSPQNKDLDSLYSYQDNVLRQLTSKFKRFALDTMDWDQRMLGIKGLRGVGKTTLLLQYLKSKYAQPNKGLYVTADHPWFYDNSLFDLIETWSRQGGKLLIIDEVHKHSQWSRELKVGYDGFPDLKFLFTASSAFDLFRAESDLSRRAIIDQLPGLSFREYLELAHGIKHPAMSLDDIIADHKAISTELSQSFKPIPLFQEYLKIGYFPFTMEDSQPAVVQKIASLVNTVLESDLAYVEDYSPSNIAKIKKLLGVIAASAPFAPNISRIAKKLRIGRTTVYNYLKHLEDADLLNLVHKPGRGGSKLQKPDKIYFENTNLAYALTVGRGDNYSVGMMRETFFLNQIRNAGHQVNLASEGDFLVNEKLTIEVGGRNKSRKQISDLENSYRALDDIETGFRDAIPLWLFGFMY